MAELFTDAELGAYLKTTVDPATATAARRIATAVIRAEIGVDPRSFDGTRQIVLAVDVEGLVRLPALFTDVVDVTTLGGQPVGYTHHDGSQVVTVSARSPYLTDVLVTYRYPTVPEEIVSAALIIAGDVVGPMSISGGSTAGIRAESVGPFSITYSENGATSVAGAPVSAFAKSLLRGYRSNVASIRLRSDR